MTVQLFVPCFIDQLYPQVAFNTVKVLEKAGSEVKYNTNQTCCGQPAFNAGFGVSQKMFVQNLFKISIQLITSLVQVQVAQDLLETIMVNFLKIMLFKVQLKKLPIKFSN